MSTDLMKEIKIVLTLEGQDPISAKISLTDKQLEQLGITAQNTSGKTKEVDGSLGKLGTTAGNTKEKVGGLRGVLNNIFGEDIVTQAISFATSLGLVAGAAELIRKGFQFISDSLSAFNERKTAILGIESTIKSMGKESVITADGIFQMAEQMERANKFRFEANQIMDVAGFLLSFDKITTNILPKATQMVIDLAAKMNTDLKSASLSLGIALDNPAEGLMRLGRAGIKFSKDEQQVIQDLVNTGHAAEAQDKIFDTLQKKVGGYAANTVTAWQETKNILGEGWEIVERKIGSVIASILSPLNSIVKSISVFENEMTDAAIKGAAEQKSKFDILATTYLNLKDKVGLSALETNNYKEAVNQLTELYPNYFKNINLEKDGYDKVKVAIDEARIALDKYLQSKIAEATLTADTQKLAEKYAKGFDIEKQISETQNKISELKESGKYNKYENVNLGKGEITKADLTYGQYAEKNLENLRQQKEEVERSTNDILTHQRDLQAYIKSKFKDVLAPANEDTGGSGSGSDKEKSKQSMAIDELKFLSGDYYAYKINLINEEAKARLKEGQDAVAVEMAKYNKLRELAQEYLDFVDKEFKPRGFVGDANITLKTRDQLVNEVPNKLPIQDPGSVAIVKETTKQLQLQLTLTDSLKNGFSSAGNALASSMGNAVRVFSQANSLLQQFINNLASAIVQSLALKAVNTLFSFIPFLGMAEGALMAGPSGAINIISKGQARGKESTTESIMKNIASTWQPMGSLGISSSGNDNNHGSNLDNIMRNMMSMPHRVTSSEVRVKMDPLKMEPVEFIQSGMVLRAVGKLVEQTIKTNR